MKKVRIDFYPLLFIIFIIQPIIELHISFFKYFDEIVVLWFFIGCLLKRNIVQKTNPLQSSILKLLSLFIVVGCCGNLVSSAHQPISAIIQDVLSNCKLFLFVVSIQNLNISSYRKKKIKNSIARLIHFLFVIMFFCSIISLFVNIGMTDYSEEARYGLHAFKFIYPYASGLNTYYYLFMIMHSITILEEGTIQKHAHIYTIIGIIPWVLTLRSRAIVFSFIYIVIYLYLIFIKKDNKPYKFKWSHMIMAAICAVFISWDAIDRYFISNEKSSRMHLMRQSFNIAKNYFPIGSGFGTFGTEASRKYYSFIYYEYNMWNIWGLSPEEPRFIVDQFWFGIIGQFGVIGTVIIAMLIFKVYKNIWKISSGDKAGQIAVLTLFITSIFASLTAGTFIQASILPSVLVFFLVYGKNSNEYTYYIAR